MYQAIIYANVYEDDYEHGELDEVNFWTQTFNAETPKKLLEKLEFYIPKDAITEMYQEDINEYEDSSEYWTSWLVDNDNYPASDEDIKQWRKGKKKLYTTNCQILVSKLTSSKALLPKMKVTQ